MPAPERRSKTRPVQPATPTRLPNRGKVVGLSVAGLGLLGIVQWLAKGRQAIERAAMKNPGELK